MKILVTGARGFVGHKLMEMSSETIAAPLLRNASLEDVRKVIEESEADVIFHTAAISDIRACQNDPEAAYHANVLLPEYLARVSAGRKLICFSSDQVYSGCEAEGPYTEETVCPANLYAEQKLEMEQRVLEIHPEAVILRAEWMYDYWNQRSNYLMTILNAEESVFFSSRQYRGVTWLKEVAENMKRVISLPGGVYNFGSETDRSLYDITCEFVKYIGKDIHVEDCEPRHNLWMNCDKAKSYGVVFSEVMDGLKRCADEYGFRKG